MLTLDLSCQIVLYQPLSLRVKLTLFCVVLYFSLQCVLGSIGLLYEELPFYHFVSGCKYQAHFYFVLITDWKLKAF